MSTLLTDLPGLALPDPTNAPRCFQLDRRTFLQLFGGGLLVCLSDAPGIAQESGRGGFGGGRQQVPSDISAWIHIAADKRLARRQRFAALQNHRQSALQVPAVEASAAADREEERPRQRLEHGYWHHALALAQPIPRQILLLHDDRELQ